MRVGWGKGNIMRVDILVITAFSRGPVAGTYPYSRGLSRVDRLGNIPLSPSINNLILRRFGLGWSAPGVGFCIVVFGLGWVLW